MFKYLLIVIALSTVYHRGHAFYNFPVRVTQEVQGAYSSQRHTYADGATKIIDLILETVAVKASFEVKRANVPNAAAVVYQGKRYILYNPSFIAAMDKAAGSRWASVAVLAHEIGHHLHGHTLDGKGSLPSIELEADEFSGFVLRKMGASLSESQVALRIMAGTKATRTHPGRSDRLLAVANGWNRADDQLNDQHVAEKKPSLSEADSSKESSLVTGQIAFDVHFNFDPTTTYHVTIRNNLVKLLDDKIYILGRLLSTGKTYYPLAFQTGSEEFLLISRTGKIINDEGKTLGYIARRN
jgi:hypothetical protein